MEIHKEHNQYVPEVIFGNLMSGSNYDDTDERTVAGGHYGIGSLSNVFGTCRRKPYDGAKFLDLFKNKVINDISGVKWGITMPWNEVEDVNRVIKPEEVNKKLVDIGDVRGESEVRIEKEEREILNYIVVNGYGDFQERKKLVSNFKDITMKKIYQIWLETHFDDISDGELKVKDVDSIMFKKNKMIEDTELFNRIVDKFDLTEIYATTGTVARGNHRKELKRVFKIIFNMLDEKYLKKDTLSKLKIWKKN